MFRNEPFFEFTNGWVIVWIGDISGSDLDRYLHESGGAAEDAPISLFSQDLGSWYDHHQVWGGVSTEAQPIAELADFVGLEPPSLIEELRRRARDQKATCILVLFEAKILAGTQRSFADGGLRVLGCWPETSPVDY